MSPLISFVIPCFNLPEALVRACLDSILSLSLRPGEREIIVVDDGSEPTLEPLLEPYRQDVIFVRKANGGVGDARNEGLKRCKGRYVHFVDGDDALIADGYGQVLSLLRNHEPDVLMFRGANHPEAVSRLRISAMTTGAAYMSRHNMRAAVWGYIFERTLAGGLWFDVTLKYGEDEYFTDLLILRSKRLLDTTVPAYHYRPRPTSAMHDKSPSGMKKRLDDGMKVMKLLAAHYASSDEGCRAALARRVAQLGMDHLYNVMRFTKSRRVTEKSVNGMIKEGMFPLPMKRYTFRYAVFALLSRYRAGRDLLRFVTAFFNP